MIDALHALTRFCDYGALMLLLGSAAFPYVGLRKFEALRRDADLLNDLGLLAMVAVGVTMCAMASSLGATMGQMPWEISIDMAKAMIVQTNMGWAFLVRIAALLVICLVATRAKRSHIRTMTALVLGGVALTTLTWSGHVAASAGAIGVLHRLNDTTHLIAASLWIGAIGGFALMTTGVHKDADLSYAHHLRNALQCFAPVGIVLVGIVAITGLVNANLIFELGRWQTVLAKPYGTLLAAKLCLVIAMLGCAAANLTIGREERVADEKVISSLRTSLVIEFGLGCSILAIVSVMGLASPMG